MSLDLDFSWLQVAGLQDLDGFFPGPISFQRMRMWHDAVETIVDFPQS